MIEILEPPVGYPVSVELLKNFLRVTHTQDDALIEHCLASAVETVEHKLDKALITRTLRYSFGGGESVCHWPVVLPFHTIEQITSFEVLSSIEAGYTAVPETLWELVADSLMVRDVHLLPDIVDSPYAYRVTYIAGYGSQDSPLFPASIKQAILTLAGLLYQGQPLTEQAEKSTLSGLIQRFKMHRLL